MPTLTIKSLPEALYQRLKAQATAHRRSLNSEVLVCLEHAVTAEAPDTLQRLARVDALRGRLQAARVAPLTEAILAAARAAGRS